LSMLGVGVTSGLELMRILCLQLKRIGDAILTAPALAALREEYPRAHLTLVLHGPSGGLGPAFASVDEVLVYESGRLNAGLWGRVLAGDWAACYDFSGSDRSAILARLSRAQRVFGYRKVVEKRGWRGAGYTDLCEAGVRGLHTVDYHLALTGLPAPGATGFELPCGAGAGVEGMPEGEFVVVHPGTARSEKYWSAERWADVISRLPGPVVVTGSGEREEQAHLAALRRALGGRAAVCDLSGRLTLLQWAAVVGRARLVLSVDSAAMHVAAMAGRPQVALFGPTNPFHWRPRHDRARVVLAGAAGGGGAVGPRHEAAAMDALSTGEVLAAIEEVLGVPLSV